MPEEEREIRDYMLPFLDVDDPVVIRMRHEPHEAAARLLVSLGAGWIVDEGAPPCVRACGRKECLVVKDVSAHDLTRTRFCVEAICPEDAIAGSDRCREHTEQAAQAAKRRSATTRRLAPWDRAEAVVALQAVGRELGRCPFLGEIAGRPDVPSAPTYSKLFGGFADYCEAAGFERPSRGRRRPRALGEVASARSGEAVQPAASPNAHAVRLRVAHRFSQMRAEIDAMERELLNALEEEAA